MLRDGAAAQYGSDAIARVMNLQLKDARSGGVLEAFSPGADGASTPAHRPRGRQQPTHGAPARRRADELGPRLRNSRRRCHPRPLPFVGSSGRFRLAAKALAPASVGVVHTISPVKAAAVYEGISMIATRAHARLSTAKGRRMGESPRVCCQLAAHRRTPPTSNNTASAIAPAIGRAGTGVRSATIENWSAVALGLPALSCDAPAAMSTVTVPEAAGVIVTV